MLLAIGASFVFQVLTSPSVGNYWVVLGMVVGVLDPRMDSVLDPNNSGLERVKHPNVTGSILVTFTMVLFLSCAR
jgi:hypothetical protein